MVPLFHVVPCRRHANQPAPALCQPYGSSIPGHAGFGVTQTDQHPLCLSPMVRLLQVLPCRRDANRPAPALPQCYRSPIPGSAVLASCQPTSTRSAAIMRCWSAWSKPFARLTYRNAHQQDLLGHLTRQNRQAQSHPPTSKNLPPPAAIQKLSRFVRYQPSQSSIGETIRSNIVRVRCIGKDAVRLEC
jgi:hypothetical protein